MIRRPLSFSLGSLLLALALFFLAPAAAGAAQKKQPEPESFFGTVDVNVVNVEVFVTDAQGNFVPGLTREDFEIVEDGKPVEISNFYISEGSTEPAETETPAALPEEQRLYLTIFFDNQSLAPANRNRMIEPIKDFIRNQLGPDDRVLLVSYDGPGSMKVRQATTSDPQAILTALDEVSKESASGLDRLMDYRQVVREIDRGSVEARMGMLDAEQSYQSIRLYAQANQDRVRNSLASLGHFVDALSGLPGRKALLYISGGMSLRPAQALFQAWQNKYGGRITRLSGAQPELDSFQTDSTTRFRDIGERANANRITFYSLGLPTTRSTNEMLSGSYRREQEMLEQANLEQSLLLVVAPTGGLAVFDPSKPQNLLDKMRFDFDHYYSLGYSPADRKVASNHRIEVKVKRPGLKVRHREGYRDRTSRDRLNHKTMAALLFGTGDENPLEIGVRFEKERGKKRGQREVSLLVAFPMSKLVLLPQDKFHEGKVTLLLGARDDQGRTSDITQIDLPIRVPNAQMPRALDQTIGYRTNLTLRAGAHTVVVGVRDEIGNVNSTVLVPFTSIEAAGKAGR